MNIDKIMGNIRTGFGYKNETMDVIYDSMREVLFVKTKNDSDYSRISEQKLRELISIGVEAK